jgi:hypothetical protein
MIGAGSEEENKGNRAILLRPWSKNGDFELGSFSGTDLDAKALK